MPGRSGVTGERCVPSTPEKTRSPIVGLVVKSFEGGRRSGVVSSRKHLFSASPFVLEIFLGITLSVNVNPL